MGKLIMSEEYLPTDVIFQIISRLPAKSVARCRCLSKLWASLLTLGSPYFTELFLTQSVTRPRLLFPVLRENNEWWLYSCPQPQISSTNCMLSISVTAEFHMSLPKTNSFLHISPSVSGLMYFYNIPNLNNPKLCNPATGHLFSLPQLTKTVCSFFGYDPINKQFSVLAICRSNYQILKLGSQRQSWKSLKCPLHHSPCKLNICINGVLYYMARLVSNPWRFKIVCFDLNSEEFKLIDQPCDPHLLVNFKSKLGVINANWVEPSKKGSHLELSLWVLEDIKKQEWSTYVYDILPTELWNKKREPYCIVGMTAMGDVVLTSDSITYPLYVYFFNLEKKALQKVEIKGFGFCKDHAFRGCVDYVEELRGLNWS